MGGPWAIENVKKQLPCQLCLHYIIQVILKKSKEYKINSGNVSSAAVLDMLTR